MSLVDRDEQNGIIHGSGPIFKVELARLIDGMEVRMTKSQLPTSKGATSAEATQQQIAAASAAMEGC